MCTLWYMVKSSRFYAYDFHGTSLLEIYRPTCEIISTDPWFCICRQLGVCIFMKRSLSIWTVKIWGEGCRLWTIDAILEQICTLKEDNAFLIILSLSCCWTAENKKQCGFHEKYFLLVSKFFSKYNFKSYCKRRHVYLTFSEYDFQTSSQSIYTSFL